MFFYIFYNFVAMIVFLKGGTTNPGYSTRSCVFVPLTVTRV